MLGSVRELLGLDSAPAAKLALFHTAFNILGVFLIWPLADWLTDFCSRFSGVDEDWDQAKPRYLDKTVLPRACRRSMPGPRSPPSRQSCRWRRCVAATAESPLPGHGPLQPAVVARLNASIADFILSSPRSQHAADSAGCPNFAPGALLRISRRTGAGPVKRWPSRQTPAGDAPARNSRLCTGLARPARPRAPADVRNSREGSLSGRQALPCAQGALAGNQGTPVSSR